jgi:hypothetical protein
MRHHRAAWRVERIGWLLMVLVLAATLLGVFGDGPLSHARSGSSQHLSVRYDRLLRSSAPAQYAFVANAAGASAGELRLRFDRSLMEDIELDSIVPQPETEDAGPDYTEFAFRVRGNAPVNIDLRYRPATFGRRSGRVSVGGQHAVLIDQFVYP